MNQTCADQTFLKRYVLTSLRPHLENETNNVLADIEANAGLSDEGLKWRPVKLVDSSLQLAQTILEMFEYSDNKFDVAQILSDFFKHLSDGPLFKSQGAEKIPRLYSLLRLHLTCLAWAFSSGSISSSKIHLLETLEERVFYNANLLRLVQDIECTQQDWIDESGIPLVVDDLIKRYSSPGLISCVSRLAEDLEINQLNKIVKYHMGSNSEKKEQDRRESNRGCFKNLTNLQTDGQNQYQQKIDFSSFSDRNKQSSQPQHTNQMMEEEGKPIVPVVEKRELLFQELKIKCEKENKEKKNHKVIELKAVRSNQNDESRSKDQTSSHNQLKVSSICNKRRGMLKVSYNTQVYSQKRPKKHSNSPPHQLPFNELKQKYLIHNQSFITSDMEEHRDRSPSPDQGETKKTEENTVAYKEKREETGAPVLVPVCGRKQSDCFSAYNMIPMDMEEWSNMNIVAKSTPIRQNTISK